MLNLNAQFTFHPVGQGCFYSGEIKQDKMKPFHFIYDCGSESSSFYIEKEIESYKAKIDCVLDLLIISHFDSDHVNHVKKLLNGIRCRRLVIPYCYPIERLYVCSLPKEFLDDYTQMMKDPVSYWLDNAKIDEIIIVGSPEFDEPLQINSTNSVAKPRNFEEDNRLNFTDYYDEIGTKTFKDNLPIEEKKEPFAKMDIKYYQAPFKFTIGDDCWEFLFYHKKGYKHDIVYRMSKEIQSLLGPQQVSDLFSEIGITKIKKLYHDILKGGLNSTSLIVLHLPGDNIKLVSEGGDWNLSGWSNLKEAKVASLLTGDIDLDGPAKTKNLVAYFSSYFERVNFFQVPHHGSGENWKTNNKEKSLYEFQYYIVNFGLGNSYGHPKTEVIDDIKTNVPNAIITLNNQCTTVSYELWLFHKDNPIIHQVHIPIEQLPDKIKLKLKTSL